MSWKHSVWRAFARARGLLGALPQPGLRILGYHAVGTALPGDPYGLSVKPADFTRQMELVGSNRWGRSTSLGEAKIDASPEICVSFDDGYEDTLSAAAPILSRFRLPFTVFVTPGLLDSGKPYLSWSQLKELAQFPGAEIGAHGLTHKRLDGLDENQLACELRNSRKRLEDALGREVAVMSWPHGAASRRTAAAAAEAGFVRAASSLYGANAPGRNPLLLKRVEITGFDDERDFIGKGSGSWDWFALRQGDPARR